LQQLHRQFLEMLADGRHVFDTTANALLGGTDPEVIREDLYTTDQRINRTEQAIRRELVVHGSVHGAAHLPALLVLMSLVKDAERIGDYAKNIFELAVARPDLGTGSERADLVQVKDQISKLLVRASGLFESQDEIAAQAYLAESDALLRHCDEKVGLLMAERERNVVGPALAYRYFKRVASHAGNVVTSIVMPLDKLDYYPNRSDLEQ
jgi:phosphate uptake regulator